ncbi:MAG TPA: RdgB/HAM1 family non-canonical purine NTP pyrophosphatase [Steroidobacteraceae bacterium]|nr:RdgB/HAM1 family non-canonical purine NTP pyrophosphatase [Steroidobacteraceae bacterium]
MTRVVLASGNAGKLRELAALLAPLDLTLVPQGELGVRAVEETGATFLANALLKARHAAAATLLPALADDSGLEVDALNGRPGVWSARFAGVAASDQENLEYLLRELKDVPQAQRRARYQCVIVLVRSGEDPAPLVAHGSWEGRIAAAARGSGGFGYDPVFVPTGDARSAAQLSPAEKNAVSHRGQALRALLAGLRAAGVYFRP